MAGLITLIAEGMSKGKKEPEEKEEKEEPSEMETVAAEFLLACDKRDPELLVKAFRAMFSMCELEPHEEADGNKRALEKPGLGGYLDETDL